MGVFRNDSQSINGYTLFSPVSDFNTYLIDNCGALIKEWHFNNVPGMMAYLLPDGRLIRAGRLFNSFGAGGSGGLIEIRSWDDEKEWEYRYSNDTVKQHHDFEYMPSGNILIMAWERRPITDILAKGRIPESIGSNGVWMEQIVEVRPTGFDTGEIVWSWHVYDHLVQDQYPALENFGSIEENPGKLNINYSAFSELNPNNPGAADWMHLNAIDYNPELDLIVISSRNTSEIYVIDHSTTTEEAATDAGGRYGKGGDFLFRYGNDIVHDPDGAHEQILFAQHDASWVQRTGNYTSEISIFNNGLGRDEFNTSSVEIILPAFEMNGFTYNETDRQFEIVETESIFPNDDYPFSSARISGAQVLDDDHVLITSGNTGSVYELDSQRKLIWQYVNPVSQIGPVPQGSNPFLNDIFRALRYKPDYPAFVDRDLTAGELIELEPVDYGCEIFDDATSILDDSAYMSFPGIFPNPANDVLEFKDFQELETVNIIDNLGHIRSTFPTLASSTIDIHFLDPGVYYVTFKWRGKHIAQKLVKH